MAKKENAKLKYTRVKPATNVAISALFIFLALLCLMPALLVLIVSLSSEASIRVKGYSYIPNQWSLQAFAYLMNQSSYIGRAFLNSIGITVVGTVLGLIMTSTMGFALSRPNYRLRGFFTWFIFIPMLFSGGLVASYMINAHILGLKDTYWALILPICCSSFYCIIMRTFFQTTVPFDLIEAATIDGSGEYSTLARIVLPIMKPGIATIALLTALAYWNEWFLCLLYVTKRELYPLQYLLMEMQRNAEFLARNSSMIGASGAEAIRSLPSQTMRMAVVVFIVLPIACAYPFFQRYVVEGLTIGSVKG